MICRCEKCGMGVKGLLCEKCDAELVAGSITTDAGEAIQVAKCPNGCGMIKSPMCCGQDMSCNVG